MNRLKSFFLLDKTDVDKVLLWGHNLQLKKGNKSQYIAILISQYSAYRNIF